MPVLALRAKPYKENGQLLDLFSAQTGVLRAVAHGSLKPSSPLKGVLQPFCLAQATIAQGKGMPIVKNATLVRAFNFVPPVSFCAQYLNELVFFLLEKEVPQPGIFGWYVDALCSLESGEDAMEPTLRTFEMAVLDDIGYGLELERDCEGKRLSSTSYYSFDPGVGLVPRGAENSETEFFTGASLSAMAKRDFAEKDARTAAKKICRRAIAERTGGRNFVSRELCARYYLSRRRQRN